MVKEYRKSKDEATISSFDDAFPWYGSPSIVCRAPHLNQENPLESALVAYFLRNI